MQESSIIYLCINLPHSQDRRDFMTQQAAHLGLSIRYVQAVSGAELQAPVAGYDARARLRIHPANLSPNQMACVLSHKKALAGFLESEAEYAVVLEDDSLLEENIKSVVHELVHHVQGWEIAKLYAPENDTEYSVGDAGGAGAQVRVIFPKKLMWGSVAYLYSRRGAQRLLEGMRSFSAPADVQIAVSILEQGIPTIAVSPPVVRIPGYDKLPSTITPQSTPGPRRRTLRRSLCQYIRYRMYVWWYAVSKWFMRRRMRRLIRRV